jgi:hypothetical protein
MSPYHKAVVGYCVLSSVHIQLHERDKLKELLKECSQEAVREPSYTPSLQ